MLRALAAAVAALLTLLASPAAAQPASGTISGSALLADTSCQPAADAVVQVSGTASAQTVTEADGTFALAGLAPGDYDVAVSPPPAFETGTAAVTVEADESVAAQVSLDPAVLPTERVAGLTRVETAIVASRRAFSDGAPVVLIATAGAYPDALVAAPLAARLGGPLLLVEARSGAAVLDEVRRLGADQAVIVGAISGVTAVVQAELLARGLEVRRIAGVSRFDTAALVARELGASPDGEVAIATGLDFADALSFAAPAAASGIPILLTRPDELPADSAEALAALGATRTIVLGGVQAVGDGVAVQLPSPTRVAGVDRYATSVAIAELARERGADLGTVYVATGDNWPDALAAGPVAALTRGTLLLLGDSGAPADFLIDSFAAIDNLVAFGGAVALGDDVLAATAQPAGPRGDCG